MYIYFIKEENIKNSSFVSFLRKSLNQNFKKENLIIDKCRRLFFFTESKSVFYHTSTIIKINLVLNNTFHHRSKKKEEPDQLNQT
jgi:hypothetical protein